ncbi:MAG: HAD family phosphatase [Actinomycetota bacterium]|nr:HAD family phosphatase [Actinomycetota bacterium]
MTPASLSAAAKTHAVRRTKLPAAVVFDADGVLVDTEPAWAAARGALFNQHGEEFGEAEDRQTLGTGLAGTAAALTELLGEPDHEDELRDKLLTLLIAEVSKQPPRPLPGAVELVNELRGRLPIAVASNSPRALLQKSLEAARLDGLFDAVLGVDEVPHAKPAPDLYLAAVMCLGADPKHSVAVEDSPAGVTSARGAGLYVIGIQSLAHVSLKADEVADSLTDPRLRARLGLTASRSAGYAL